MLISMVDDPDECTNLADSPDHQSVLDQLKRQLIIRIAQTPPPVRD